MKLLLDANLSWRMIAVLKQYFEDCLHVDYIGLNVPSSDKEIWAFAKNNDLIIVTNDEDQISTSLPLQDDRLQNKNWRLQSNLYY